VALGEPAATLQRSPLRLFNNSPDTMPTFTEEPAATGRLYVALCADATGRYAHIVVTADSWSHAVDQLEDAGAEVIEDQSEDYEPDGLATFHSREEVGAVALEDLGVTDFIRFTGGN